MKESKKKQNKKNETKSKEKLKAQNKEKKETPTEKQKEIIEKPNKSLKIILVILIIITIVFYTKEYYNRLKTHNRIIKHNLNTKINKEEGLFPDDIVLSLYNEEPYAPKYYFKGENINNYLIFSNICWRIVNITNNNSLKLIYYGTAKDNKCNLNLPNETIPWDELNINDWNTSSLKQIFNNWEKDNIIYNTKVDFTSEKSKIANATWYTGSVKISNRSNRDAIIDEHFDNEANIKTEYTGQIGLINISDYLKATTSCNYNGAYMFKDTCGKANYLYNNKNYWVLNKTYGNDIHVWAVHNGGLESRKAENPNYLVLPSIYLKPNILIKGKGTILKPYMVLDSIYELFSFWK